MNLDPALAGRALALTLRALAATWRPRLDGPLPHPDDPRRIYALWHGRALTSIAALPTILPLTPLTTMVSLTPDGDLQSHALASLGVEVIRGSTLGRGPRALVDLARALEAGRSACLAVDGPAGPPFCARSGAVALSLMTGVPIVPTAALCHTALTIPGTWDHLQLPLPGSQILIRLGQPLPPPPRTRARSALPDLLDDLQRHMAALNHTLPTTLRCHP